MIIDENIFESKDMEQVSDKIMDPKAITSTNGTNIISSVSNNSFTCKKVSQQVTFVEHKTGILTPFATIHQSKMFQKNL